MIQLGTSRDLNPNAYFNKVSVFVHGWLHIRRGHHLRVQHSTGHVCETRTAFHVAVCLNRITHCNMKPTWEFQSLIDNTLSFYSFWFLIQHKLETVTIWHTYQLMTERKQSIWSSESRIEIKITPFSPTDILTLKNKDILMMPIVKAGVLQMLTVTFYESEPSLTSIINIFYLLWQIKTQNVNCNIYENQSICCAVTQTPAMIVG